MRFNLFMACLFLAFCLTLGIWAVVDIVGRHFGAAVYDAVLSLICGGFAIRRFRMIRQPRKPVSVKR